MTILRCSLAMIIGLLLFSLHMLPSLELGSNRAYATMLQDSPNENSAEQADEDSAETDEPTEDEAAAEALDIDDPEAIELVQVDWIEEMFEGGVTMVALGILSVGLLAFLLERLFTLRRNRFVPRRLIEEVRPLFAQNKFDDIRDTCKRYPSVAADIIRHCVDYRNTGFSLLQTGASDIAARAVVDQEEKCSPLSVIAGVAPLLGLLGTMIGMIESFKLVEVFGDEGGASLLAGSISKALITTAVGLVLAIPAVLGFHWARRRVHGIANIIEVESESLLKDWFLTHADDTSDDQSSASQPASATNSSAAESESQPEVAST